MSIHQALPKKIQSEKKPKYSIRKKPISPSISSIKNISLEKSSNRSKQSVGQKTVHRINSKDKPDLHSSKNKLPRPKIISTFCLRKNNEQYSSSKEKHISFGYNTVNTNSAARSRQTIDQSSEKILGKIQNSAVNRSERELFYADFSAIGEENWLCYEGQTSEDNVRNGFGIQYFSNGEKFMGHFCLNKVQGQGTYYSLGKKVMGLWQQNKLIQVYLEF